jgi:hypothetical protein
MIDPALAFLYFGLPTMVGSIGLAAMKLHERSAPPLPEANGGRGTDGEDRRERTVG